MAEFNNEPDDDGSYEKDPDTDVESMAIFTQAEARRIRSDAAVALKIAGASYLEIAETLEYASVADAARAIEARLAETTEPEGAAWQTQRKLQRMRLDGLLKSVWEPANKSIVMDPETETPIMNPEQLSYHRAALSVLDRIAKLEGLDAPQRHVIYNPDAVEFDVTVKGLLAQTEQQRAQETDPFEIEYAEVVEAEEGELDGEDEAGS